MVAMTLAMQSTSVLGRTNALQLRKPPSQSRAVRCVVRAEQKKDSYQIVEDPVRPGVPDQMGPVSDRNTTFDKELIDADADRQVLGTEVGILDAMRFKGAAPEIINCRLAMLGFVAAAGAQARTGANILEQWAQAPGPIAATFIIIIIASLVPILRGDPRTRKQGWPLSFLFSPNAELWNGRLAMLGVTALVYAAKFGNIPQIPQL